MWLAARKATSGVPGRFQGFVEMLVDMVDQQARSIVPSAETRRFVAPLAMTVFIWIVLMNALDLIPVDLAHYVFHLMGLGIEPHGSPPLPPHSTHGRPERTDGYVHGCVVIDAVLRA